MPITQSAAKALRQTKRRAIKNLAVKKNLALLQKNFKKALSADQLEEAKKIMVILQAALDKAAKIRTISRNRSIRLKSRMMKKLRA